MTRLLRKLLIFTGVSLALFICSAPAFACQCLQLNPVDKEFAQSSNVAVLKLQSVKENETAPDDYFLSVQRVFKGGFKVDEIVKFSASGGMCTWYFSEEQIGGEFLFYLTDKPQNNAPWSIATCSRSRGVEERAGDLRYLENEKKLRNRTRLSGTLQQFIESPEDRFSTETLADRKVRVSGKGKTVNLVTDQDGFYEVYDLPPGKYKVAPEKLDGYSFSGDGASFQEIEIKDKSHTEQNFFFSIVNEISGKVLDSNGKPIEEVCLNLISVKTGKGIGFDSQYCTDKKGEFQMTSIPPGNYRLVVNEEGRITLDHPFGAFYYPNAKTAAQAAEITVGANYFLKNLILVPPETSQMVTLTGRLIFADGKPADDFMVQFLRDNELSFSPGDIIFSDFGVETNSDGEFSINVPKGQAGVLRGAMFSINPRNCPEIEEFLPKDSNRVRMLETNRVEIAGDKNVTGIELKFPFRECKRAVN